MRKLVLAAVTLMGTATSAVGIYWLATTGDSRSAIIGGLAVILIGWSAIGEKCTDCEK